MKYLFVILALSSIMVLAATLSQDEEKSFKSKKADIKHSHGKRIGSNSRSEFSLSQPKVRLARQPKATPAIPPYAVNMEPLVQYSQRDPLYHDKDDEPIVETFSTPAIGSGYLEQKSRIDHLVAEPSNHITDSISASAYSVSGTAPFYDHQSYAPHFYKEPEPIIEIIIKESNESLPAPPAPPPTPAAPVTKEPVQVFYVKYKKNPNAHGKEDDVIYDPPIPALTPQTHDLVEPSTHAHIAQSFTPAVTLPPPPTTTIKAIIRPDSEIYHGTSGLRISFGKPEEHGPHDYSSYDRTAIADSPAIEAQKRDSASDQSEAQYSQIKNPSSPQLIEKPSQSPSVHAHKRQQGEFQPPTPQDVKFTQRPNFQASQPHIDIYQTPPPPSFRPQPQQLISFSAQQSPPFRPQHTNVFSNRQQLPQPLNPQVNNQRIPPPQYQPHQSFNPNQRQQNQFIPHSNHNNQQRPNAPFPSNQQQRPFVPNQKNQQQFPIAHASNYHPQVQPQQPNFQSPQNRPNNQPFNLNQPSPLQLNPQPSNNFPHLLNHQQHQQQQQQQQQQPPQQQQQQQRFPERIPINIQQRPPVGPSFTPPLSPHHQQQYNQPQPQPTQQRPQQRPVQQSAQFQPFNGPPQGINQNIQPQQSFGPHSQQLNPNYLHQIKSNQQQQSIQQSNNHQQNYQSSSVLPQYSQVNILTSTHQPLPTQTSKPNYVSLAKDPSSKQSSQPPYRVTDSFRQQAQTSRPFGPPFISNSYPEEQYTSVQFSQSVSSEEKLKFDKKVPENQQFTQFPPNHKPEKEYKYSSISSPGKTSKSQQVFVTNEPSRSTPPRATSTARTTTYYTPTETTTFVSNQKKKLEKDAKKNEKDKFKTSLAALPDEVPDDLREQLIASGILNNADIQILDYDKVGDIPIENLPPEALEQLQGAGSAPVPSIVAPDNASIPLEMKVVRYNPESDGQKIAETYVQDDATHLDPVVLNDSKYNRYLPLKVSGTQFPLPNSPQLNGRRVSSVVVLAPVDYEFIKAAEQGTDERAGRAAAQVQGVRFIAGDVLKTLVKNPTTQNYEKWLEKEKSTPAENQSVVLLVTSSTEDKTSPDKDKEIFMYDVTSQRLSHLRGELSSTFVQVAESNAQSQDLDSLSSEDSSDQLEGAASEVEPARILPSKVNAKNTAQAKDSTIPDSKQKSGTVSKSIVISTGYSKTTEYANGQRH